MRYVSLASVVGLLLSGCAAMQTGPDTNFRFYQTAQKVGEQLSNLASLKQSSKEKVLVLNVSQGAESKFVVSDLFSSEKTRETDGQGCLSSFALDSIEDGIVSGLVSKGVYVLGSKLDPNAIGELAEIESKFSSGQTGASSQKESEPRSSGILGLFKDAPRGESEVKQTLRGNSGFATNELVYVSPNTLPALKRLKERYQFAKILTYRIITHKKPTSKMGWDETGYTQTKLRLHVRVIDADSGVVLYAGIIDSAY